MKFESNEKINFIVFLKENLPLILLGLYSLSFVNYYFYYKSFEISIFNYVGLQDLLFFSIEYIFKIVVLIFLAEIVLFVTYTFLFVFYEKITIIFVKKKFKLYLNSNKRNKKRIQYVYFKHFDVNFEFFRFTIIFLLIFVLPFLSLMLFPAFLIYFIYIIENNSDFKSIKLVLILAGIIIIISTIISTFFNSYNKRFNKDDHIISFYENSIFISTDKKVSCYNYLRETSLYIFLYDIENKESKIFFKENISNIKIKNSNEIDEYIINIKEIFFCKTIH